MLFSQTCSIHSTVSGFFETFPEKPSSEENKDEEAETTTADSDDMTPGGEFPPDLLTEWQEFFSTNLYNTVLSMFITISGKI